MEGKTGECILQNSKTASVIQGNLSETTLVDYKNSIRLFIRQKRASLLTQRPPIKRNDVDGWVSRGS